MLVSRNVLPGVACFAGALCYFVAGRTTPMGQQLRTPLLDAAFAGVLALFLFADLVIFHRNYLRDLMDRNTQGGEAQAQAETRLELGRSVRELLLPKGAFLDCTLETAIDGINQGEISGLSFDNAGNLWVASTQGPSEAQTSSA